MIYELDWRQIFDCKNPGMIAQDVAKKAREAGYDYFCHNSRIYDAETEEHIECLKGEDRT